MKVLLHFLLIDRAKTKYFEGVHKAFSVFVNNFKDKTSALARKKKQKRGTRQTFANVRLQISASLWNHLVYHLSPVPSTIWEGFFTII